MIKKLTENQCYVYAYLREDGTPYYIGKGSGTRAWKRSKKETKRPKDNSRIVILEDNLTENQAFEREMHYIALHGRKDLGTGILRNKSDGGEGSLGILQLSLRKPYQSPLGVFQYLQEGADAFGITIQAMLYRLRSDIDKWKDYYYLDSPKSTIRSACHSTDNKPYSTPEGIFQTLREGSEYYNIAKNTVHQRLNSKGDRWKDWQYIDK